MIEMTGNLASSWHSPDTNSLPEPHVKPGRRLLLVAPTEYDASVAKGVDSMLRDFDEGGFFETVIMAFPFTRKNRVVRPAPGLIIHEFGISGPTVWRQLLGPAHILRVIAAIARLARREHVAAVRATDPCLSGTVALAAGRLARKPVCVSIHADFDKRHELDTKSGAPRIFGSRRLAIALERLVLSRADMVLPIRTSLVDYALRRGALPARIHVIPHGADLSPFITTPSADALRALELPESKHIVSFVGRLSRENYIDDVLTAARLLGNRRQDIVFIVAGGGPEEVRIKQTVAAEPLLARTVRLTGLLPRAAVAALRQASSAALCPMGGFSLIEACAAGAPVIAYDTEWHRELVIDGKTGYLVPEGDAIGLAGAVERLLDDREAARKMGSEARSLALSRHDLARAMEIKRRCYGLLIEGQARL